ERFALFFPEKRPFFLEGADLFQTPIQAVYTRTITSPRWGGRVTGKEAGVRYTVLVADDQGGGTVILPGPNESSSAPQDFGSTVFVARAKRDIKLSSVGVLMTDREAKSGDAHNRVVGPDFQWRPSGNDVVMGQYLFTDTRTPNRPADAVEWTGQAFTGRAALAQWRHKTTHLEWATQYKELSDGFRADTGFVPQVGYRETFADIGWEVRPQGFVRYERTFVDFNRQVDQQGALIARTVAPGVFVQTRYNGFAVLRYVNDRVRGGDRLFDRQQIGYFAQFSPSRIVQQIGIDGTAGGDVDFENVRQARGSTISLNATLHPTNHLAVEVLRNRRRLDVLNQRLLTARVSRVKSTYTFTSRMFVRGIAQFVSTDRDPALFLSQVAPTSGAFSGSLLLAYKLNWQSVMFAGYGDDRTLSDRDRLEKTGRQFFVKLSYAFQR
ncbi:MAG TPA: hypothetical protein VGJ78_00755, partial [Vicinamibacterales bacterium]